MVAVGMVQVAVDEVVNVVAVRHGGVAAVRAVLVVLGMAVAIVLRGAIGGVGAVDGEGVFLDLAAGDVVKMPVVEIIDVPLVDDAGVAAIGAVLMVMSVVSVSHCQISFL